MNFAISGKIVISSRVNGARAGVRVRATITPSPTASTARPMPAVPVHTWMPVRPEEISPA
jgi:hypothetical protein